MISIETLQAKYGNQARIGHIERDFGKDVSEMVKQTCKRGDVRGWYVLADSPRMEMAACNVVSIDSQARITPVEQSMTSNYVPNKNKDYVPYGCYNVIRKVVSSNVFICAYVTGLSGMGKTLGIEQACAAEGRELIHINITAETSEEDLIGTYSLKDGNLIWVDGPVTMAMRRGAVLLCDEIDTADPSRIMAIQSVANGDPLYIKKTNERIVPAPGFCIIATGNTKGTGHGTDRFIGTGPLNEAFLERFAIMFEQTWPTSTVEEKILRRHLQNDEVISRLLTFAQTTRKAYEDGGVDQCITTRRLVQIAKNLQIFGKELDAVKYAVSRFDDETRDSFMLTYKSLIKGAPVDTGTDDNSPDTPL